MTLELLFRCTLNFLCGSEASKLLGLKQRKLWQNKGTMRNAYGKCMANPAFDALEKRLMDKCRERNKSRMALEFR